MNCSPITPELGTLKGLRTRLMLPEALITAIRSLPPVKPRVHFLTLEYLLQYTGRTSVNIFNLKVARYLASYYNHKKLYKEKREL